MTTKECYGHYCKCKFFRRLFCRLAKACAEKQAQRLMDIIFNDSIVLKRDKKGEPIEWAVRTPEGMKIYQD